MLLQEITAPGSCFTLQGALPYKKAYKKLVWRSSLLPELQRNVYSDIHLLRPGSVRFIFSPKLFFTSLWSLIYPAWEDFRVPKSLQNALGKSAKGG